MASTLVDSPPAAETEPTANGRPPVTGPERPQQEPVTAGAPGAGCARCGAPLAAGQDWCLQCGAGVQAGSSGSGWRSAATMLAPTAVLVLLAAGAGYAALSRHARRRAVMTATVAQAVSPPAATPPPVTTAPPLGTPGLATPGATIPLPGTGRRIKLPKIPLKFTTPPPAVTGGAGAGSISPETGRHPAKKGGASTGGASGESQPTPLLLDTNAAGTYNPYNYASSLFGDPSLTIDGDPTTSWTAQINPETSPRLAEGVLIDLKEPRKLSALALVSSSPGMTVEVYGAQGSTVPTSIVDPGWVALSHSVVIHKHRTTLKLKQQRKGFEFVTLWISRAGKASLGTATAPGHVSVGEIELFPVEK